MCFVCVFFVVVFCALFVFQFAAYVNSIHYLFGKLILVSNTDTLSNTGE